MQIYYNSCFHKVADLPGVKSSLANISVMSFSSFLLLVSTYLDQYLTRKIGFITSLCLNIIYSIDASISFKDNLASL